MKAQADGIPIQVLTIDTVEAGKSTVRSGQYKLHRAVLMLTVTQPDALTMSFLDFVRSSGEQQLIRTMCVPMDAADGDKVPAGAQTAAPSAPAS